MFGVHMANGKEAELEARRAAALQALSEIDAELEAERVASRAAVLAEVRANVRKYKITRTELTPYFPQLRKSKSSSTAKATAAVSKTGKPRGRPKKVLTETGTTE
jgi:hypothetical protein